MNAHLRTEFLRDAAMTMLVTVPTISSHLNMEAIKLTKPSYKTTSDCIKACQRCGNILIRSRTCQRINKRVMKDRPQRAMSIDGKDKYQKYQCNLCRNHITLPRPTRHVVQTPGETLIPMPEPIKDRTSVENMVPTVTEQNISNQKQSTTKSRQRKKAGLTSLISQAKSNKSTSGIGFDFLDFMKHS